MTKRSKLRYNEYYNMQDAGDELYSQSKQGRIFTDLMSLICSEDNIKLAYRNIKRNGGSYTPGIDGKIIVHIEKMNKDDYVRMVQNKLKWYKSKAVKRVEIPKPNGGTRPLGIPCICDRLVQQCIKQVLEPICEAKFHEHSYGFRPVRSAENAIACVERLMQRSNLHFVVDVDIKGFFDVRP